jgi:excisionase family DNA binding protein
MKSKGVAKTSHHTGPDRVMTVHDVSAYLRVHPSTIYKLLRRHQIPTFHVGSDWRFDIEMIDTWRLAQGKAQGKLGG